MVATGFSGLLAHAVWWIVTNSVGYTPAYGSQYIGEPGSKFVGPQPLGPSRRMRRAVGGPPLPTRKGMERPRASRSSRRGDSSALIWVAVTRRTTGVRAGS